MRFQALPSSDAMSNRRLAGCGAERGFSRGRWEGATLVVETTNVDAPRFDDMGTPQSSEISVVEHFTLSEDESRMDYLVTITDPVNFTETFNLARYWVWRPEIPLGTWKCGVDV